MEHKNDILKDIPIKYSNLLGEVSLLRQQNGKYLCMDFCNRLENLSHKFDKFMSYNFNFKYLIPVQKKQNTVTISDREVDICLDCIETVMLKTSSFEYDIELQQVLIDIYEDLYSLVSYIKATIMTRQVKVA